MKKVLLACLLGLLLALSATPVFADGDGGRIIFGDSFTLESGERMDGDLAVLGGSVVLETGSRVDGNVVVMGGNIRVAGEVEALLAAAISEQAWVGAEREEQEARRLRDAQSEQERVQGLLNERGILLLSPKPLGAALGVADKTAEKAAKRVREMGIGEVIEYKPDGARGKPRKALVASGLSEEERGAKLVEAAGPGARLV